MSICVHCVNGIPHLLFFASQQSIHLPPCDRTTATYDLSKQNYFLDPLTKLPLYKVSGNHAILSQNPNEQLGIRDILLYFLVEIPYTDRRDPEKEIKIIQNHPFFASILQNSQHRGTVLGLYEIVEQMAGRLVYGQGKPIQSLTDCLIRGNKFVCTCVTALTAACLAAWNRPLRIGVGYGRNIQFTHEGQCYNYFMDSDPGFGTGQHCWIEIFLDDKWILFDPTIYLNKLNSKPHASLLEKYRKVTIQQDISPCLYQFVVADYMKPPYHCNFTKSLFIFSGSMTNTLSLMHLLSETQDVLHVHHFQSQSHTLETTAQKVIRYFQKSARPFIYTESAEEFETSEESLIPLAKAAYKVAQSDMRGTPFQRILGTQENQNEEAVKAAENHFRQLAHTLQPIPFCQLNYYGNWLQNNLADLSEVKKLLPQELQQLF